MKNILSWIAVRASLILVYATFGFTQTSAQRQPAPDISRGASPAVMIPFTESRSIYSRIVGQDFTISVLLPRGYHTDSTALYPVLYVTDANRAFPLIANIATVLTNPRTTYPDLIVVGIGYPSSDLGDWAALRTRDLTPTNDPSTDAYWNAALARMSGRKFHVTSGGAPKFLEFIAGELIPFIEANYRISKNDRGIGGYSYGGLFALYALFTRPELFTRWFAGSPSIEYDHGILNVYEQEFAKSGKSPEGRVFLSAGKLEDSTTIANIAAMSNSLRAHSGGRLHVSTAFFPGEDHRSCMASAIMRAFRVLYGE